MNLTPQQRAAGKENFSAEVSRRGFLKTGLAAGVVAGGGLGAFYFGYTKAHGDPIRVGVIGTGDEGSVLIGAINPDYLQVTSIADIRPYSIHRAFHGDHYSDAALAARCGLMTKYGWNTEDEARRHVKVYGNYRELIDAEKGNLDGVIIALPLHLHAAAAIAAMKAGLHVLTEKLMGHSVHECKEMARVAKQTKRHLATGHQRHYNILYHEAMDTIRRGTLGDLHYIRAQWHRGNLPGGDSWRQPLPESVKPKDDLAKKLAGELASWERKLNEVTAKKNAKEIELWSKRVAQKKKQIEDELIAEAVKSYGYDDVQIKADGKVVYDGPPIEELIRWRLFDRTGGGLMAELGSHQLDAASIFISAMHGGKKQYPLNVMASANRPLFPPDRDVDDHVYCLFEFPAPGYNENDPHARRKRISVSYASINGNGFGGYGETVFGTQGTLLLEREEEVLLFRGAAVDDKIRVVEDKNKKPSLVSQPDGDPGAAALGAHALSGDPGRGYTEQIEHWAWCIRNPAPENQPHCHPKVALADAVIALTVNLAAREGRRIDFDPEWFDPASDETPEGVKPDVGRYA
ncbi:MAG TPA: gfo/Idh/MocA family oxidoreductase [Planctomycetaceae bacterium]|nr:gfo/Idh/MocA family oxidoreductase [Planctomycetaceae bacterium]